MGKAVIFGIILALVVAFGGKNLFKNGGGSSGGGNGGSKPSGGSGDGGASA